jgi:NADP-dependent 3-hydroxy acid dehydrogenase YdfG
MAAQLTGRLAGKVALVTGASSGIGRATALLFAAEGARVAVTARRDAELTSLVDEITKLGGTAAAFPADLTDDTAVAGVVDGTVARFSSLDILVNNAGVLQGGATGAASM